FPVPSSCALTLSSSRCPEGIACGRMLRSEDGRCAMAETVRETIRALLESTLVTLDGLMEASDPELPMPSSHVCAQGKDVWTLLTNDIDHEKVHVGQVLDA